jgi:hypothetical protein
MTKSSSSETKYPSAKIIMNLEESHCQATIRPNGGFVKARYLWVEGLMTIEEYLQSAKTPNRGSFSNKSLCVESIMPLEVSYSFNGNT